MSWQLLNAIGPWQVVDRSLNLVTLALSGIVGGATWHAWLADVIDGIQITFVTFVRLQLLFAFRVLALTKNYSLEVLEANHDNRDVVQALPV